MIAEHRKPFELAGVERCEPPHDAAAGAWCQYTITQGDNVITCVRKGSRNTVTRAANEIVAVLNERRGDRRGRVHLIINRGAAKA
ncbi:MAG: hypothetical protein P8Z76_21305 [Alphaproteobacteria bacterium]